MTINFQDFFSSAEGAAKSFHCKKNSGGYFLNKNKNLRIAQSYVSVRCFVSRRKETFCVPKKVIEKKSQTGSKTWLDVAALCLGEVATNNSIRQELYFHILRSFWTFASQQGSGGGASGRAPEDWVRLFSFQNCCQSNLVGCWAKDGLSLYTARDRLGQCLWYYTLYQPARIAENSKLSHLKNRTGPMFPNLIDWSDKPGSGADSVPD